MEEKQYISVFFPYSHTLIEDSIRFAVRASRYITNWIHCRVVGYQCLQVWLYFILQVYPPDRSLSHSRDMLLLLLELLQEWEENVSPGILWLARIGQPRANVHVSETRQVGTWQRHNEIVLFPVAVVMEFALYSIVGVTFFTLLQLWRCTNPFAIHGKTTPPLLSEKVNIMIGLPDE